MQAGPGLDGLPDPNNMYWLMDTDGTKQHRKGTEIVNLTNEQSLAIHQVRYSCMLLELQRLGKLLMGNRQ